MGEIWDLYDRNLNRTEQTFERGSEGKIPEGLYHPAVTIYIVDREKKKILLTQRAACKKKPFMWEVPGGACIGADIDFLDSCIREVKEEVGITLEREQLQRFTAFEEWGEDWCVLGYYTWVNADACDIVLQEEEVMDYKWVTTEELAQMDAEGKVLELVYEKALSVMERKFDYLSELGYSREDIVSYICSWNKNIITDLVDCHENVTANMKYIEDDFDSELLLKLPVFYPETFVMDPQVFKKHFDILKTEFPDEYADIIEKQFWEDDGTRENCVPILEVLSRGEVAVRAALEVL